MRNRRPVRLVASVKRSIRKLGRLRYIGSGRYCPVCKKRARKFKPAGIVSRKNAECPWCGSLERHRFLYLFLERQTDLFNGSPWDMLHVAPEACLRERFRSAVGEGYLSGDLHKGNAMVKMDITDIRYPDDSFDCIYCSHVLEHVQEDIAAMKEFYRVLKPNRWAILLVPIVSEKTFEDPDIVDPDERMKVYGHPGHVRNYGPDYIDRLKLSGFDVSTIRTQDIVDTTQAIRMGLGPAAGDIFFCTKP